jgi:hypothetical protein
MIMSSSSVSSYPRFTPDLVDVSQLKSSERKASSEKSVGKIMKLIKDIVSFRTSRNNKVIS